MRTRAGNLQLNVTVAQSKKIDLQFRILKNQCTEQVEAEIFDTRNVLYKMSLRLRENVTGKNSIIRQFYNYMLVHSLYFSVNQVYL